MIKSPLVSYEADLKTGRIVPDPEQRHAIEKLNTLFHELTTPRLARFLKRKKTKGLYLLGSVGVGKTYLMDLFYDALTIPKLRQHFFTFLLNIHQRLRNKQGQKNPLLLIAKEIAAETRVLCFDEFFVDNIVDAMILGELFTALFEAGVVLVATSNTAPDDLYLEGLQRERFLPFIAALKAHTDVLTLHTQQDYRKQIQKPATLYFFPLNEQTAASMQNAFDFYNLGGTSNETPLEIHLHQMIVIKKSAHVLWCHFDVLCKEDRSQNDYIALSEQFNTILIDDMDTIKSNEHKIILRFIHLIDILYDAQKRVVIRATITAEKIYPEGPYQFEFTRTLSRLIEMQSNS